MIEKVFKIISNSETYLTAETIAMALLKQITLNPQEPDVIFGVIEIDRENKEQPELERCSALK